MNFQIHQLVSLTDNIDTAPPISRHERLIMAPSASPIGNMSPISSPRLPSPPPFPEVQLGPKSPGIDATQGGTSLDTDDTTKLDQGALRRIRLGTKAADFAGPPLIPLIDVSVTSLLPGLADESNWHAPILSFIWSTC